MKYLIKKATLGFLEDKPTVWKIQKLSMATVTEKELIKYIANSSHVPVSTVKACLLAISEAITYFVINGHYVTFENFGSFYLKIDTKVTFEKEECSAKQVQGTTIGFSAASALEEVIKETEIEKVDSLSKQKS